MSRPVPTVFAVTILVAALVLCNVATDRSAVAGEDAALPGGPGHLYESTAMVESETPHGVTLRFEVTRLPDADAPGGDEPAGAPIRYSPAPSAGARTAADPEGRTWRAVSDDPGPFTLLVRVPDTGAIESRVVEASAGSEGALVPPGLDAAALVDVSEPAIMRDLRVVRVTFSPRATDASGETFATSLTLSLRATGGGGVNEKVRHHARMSPVFRRIYESEVINFSEDSPLAAGSAESGHRASSRGRDGAPTGSRYLVITDYLYEDAIQPLIEWRTAQGLPPAVLVTYPVGLTDEDVRDLVEDAYFSWDIPPEFLLLVGDTEVLPTYREGPEFHTDNFYATMEGFDYLSDILVGRLAVDTVEECETVVAKTLAYEQPWLATDPSWLLSGSLLLRNDFDMGDMIYYDNTYFIHDLMNPLGFDPIDILTLADDVELGDVLASINAGPGWVNYRGVAGAIWAQPFTFSPTSLVNEWRAPIVISATCYTGMFIGDPNFSELWLRSGTPEHPIGGVAFYGTNTSGQGETLSLKRGYVDEGLFGSALVDGRSLGEACLAGKTNLFAHVFDQAEYEGWNLLGDPALAVWTAVASPLEVTYEVAVEHHDVDLTVTVNSEGAPVEDALVTCIKDTSLYLWAETDAAGEVVFSFEAVLPCTVRLSATTKNAIPWIDSPLLGPAEAFLIYESMDVDDSVGGNGDGFLSPGETADVSLCLNNIGGTEATDVEVTLTTTDEHATIVEPTSIFPDVGTGGITCSTTPFVIEMSDDWPGGNHVPIELSMAYAGTTSSWRPPPLPTVTGKLAAETPIIDDATPGGDADGNIAPGETAALTVPLRNAAGADLTGVRAHLTTTDPFVSVISGHAGYADAGPDSLVSNDGVPFVVSVAPSVPTGHRATLSLRVEADAPTYAYAETLRIDLDVFTSLHTLPSGPDHYGYYAYDSTDTLFEQAPAYEWIDIAPPGPGTRQSRVSDGDDRTKFMFSPFVNTYYGDTTYDVVLCSNGFVALEMTNFAYGDNSAIPSDLGPPSMVAPFWTDLNPSAGGDVYTWSDLAGGRFVVQYENVRHKNSEDTETFQIIFYDPASHPTPTGDSRILFQYESVSQPDSCTIGIESPQQNDGLEIAMNGEHDPRAAPIADGLAILFTTAEPETLVLPWLVLSDLAIDDTEGGNGNGLAEPGETVSVIVELANEGLAEASEIDLVLRAGDSMVAVVDSTASVSDIPSGGSASNGADPFSMTIAEARDDTLATVWLHVGGNAATYQRPLRCRIDIEPTGEPPITQLAFAPCYPNPFTGGTQMSLALPEPRHVQLRVYNVAGRLVRTVADEPYDAGPHLLEWDGTDGSGNRVASGIYFVRLTAGSDTRTRKAVLLR